MKKKILIALTLGMITIGGTAGCESSRDDIDFHETNNAFEMLSKEKVHINSGINDDDYLVVIKNKETGKRFIIYKGYRKGGITPLD